MTAFEKLINWMPKSFDVLDVGAAGLEGENTTDTLVKRFKGYTGICIRPEKVAAYLQLHPELTGKLLCDDFYSHPFNRHSFDLVVLDMNIDNNMARDWTDEGLARAWELLKPGGYLINYVMMTDQYGDPETPAQIREHWRTWWQGPINPMTVGNKLYSIRQWEVVATEKEERRPYILWVLLKKR